MNKELTISKEGADIAKAVAKRFGVPDGSVVIHARVREKLGGAPSNVKGRAQTQEPVLAIGEDAFLRPMALDSLVGVRLGMAVRNDEAGMPCEWAIVVRRNGEKLCKVTYSDEGVCESEREMLREMIDKGEMFKLNTKATGIKNYNPETGREL